MEEESSKKIHSAIIIEVMGTPKEYIVETLEGIIKNIKEEKNLSILDSKIHEPVEVKDQKGIYSTFSEIEIQTKDLFDLTLLMFKYMPSHVEIISPENLKVENNFMNNLLNEIVRRLHGYDNLARIFEFEKSKLLEEIKKLKEKSN